MGESITDRCFDEDSVTRNRQMPQLVLVDVQSHRDLPSLPDSVARSSVGRRFQFPPMTSGDRLKASIINMNATTACVGPEQASSNVYGHLATRREGFPCSKRSPELPERFCAIQALQDIPELARKQAAGAIPSVVGRAPSIRREVHEREGLPEREQNRCVVGDQNRIWCKVEERWPLTRTASALATPRLFIQDQLDFVHFHRGVAKTLSLLSMLPAC